MSAISDYLEVNIINHMLRNQAYTPATTIYAALFDTTASLVNLEAGTLTGEISTSGTAYGRQAITLGAASGATGAVSNSADLTWTTATASWGTVRFVAIMDGGTAGAGNVLMFAQLSADKTVASGDQFKILAGDLDVTIA